MKPRESNNSKKKHFAILGNALSGTTLLFSCLNLHSKIKGEHEQHWQKPEYIKQWICARDDAGKQGLIYCNKMPIDKLCMNKWKDAQIISIAKYFHIIWLFRRWLGYQESASRRMKSDKFARLDVKTQWDKSNEIFWAIRNETPDRIISVHYEDLLFRLKIELMRICAFLDLKFEKDMMIGKNPSQVQKYIGWYKSEKFTTKKAFNKL